MLLPAVDHRTRVLFETCFLGDYAMATRVHNTECYRE